jgi:dienelactone hydrolase
MKEKEVQFQDKQGRKVVGTLLLPKGAGPFPAVIVCPGFKGTRNQLHIKQIAERITGKGLVSLRIDFTNEPGESSLPFADMTPSYEIEVLDEAIKFLKSQKEVDPNRVGLTGHSLGGLIVAWYAANHPEIKAVAPLSGVYSFPRLIDRHSGEGINAQQKIEAQEKGFVEVYSNTLKKKVKIKAAFFQDAQNFDMDKVIDRVVCPILVVAGTADKAVSIDHAQHYYDRAFSEKKELKIIKGSDHNYSDTGHLEEVSEAVAGWFARTL